MPCIAGSLRRNPGCAAIDCGIFVIIVTRCRAILALRPAFGMSSSGPRSCRDGRARAEAAMPGTINCRSGPHKPKCGSESGPALRRVAVARRCTLSMRQYLRQEFLRAVAAGLAEEILLRRIFDDLAAVHEDHAVGDLAGKAHLMGHHHHG